VTPIERAVSAYVAAWNGKDAAAREAALRSCWAPNGTIVTPGKVLVGVEQVLGEIEALRRAHPDDEAVLTSVIDQQHDVFRFSAHLVRKDGSTWGETLDVGELDSEGRIARILSFPGAAPAPR
jgi:hypothetical protein